jgi:AcrR family transcriptional regulator
VPRDLDSSEELAAAATGGVPAPTGAALPLLPLAAELPVAGQAPRRRADAARNHEAVLCAASRLFAEHGVEKVSMDAVAAAAGVGKGTLFRRFGDRAGLAGAVLGEHEAELQDQLIRGPAPLGPGAEPIERLQAFGTAYLEFLDTWAELKFAAEAGHPAARYGRGPFLLYRTHVVMLVRQAAPQIDAEYLADVLLAPLGADFFVYQRVVRERSLPELVDAYRALVERLLTCR